MVREKMLQPLAPQLDTEGAAAAPAPPEAAPPGAQGGGAATAGGGGDGMRVTLHGRALHCRGATV